MSTDILDFFEGADITTLDNGSGTTFEGLGYLDFEPVLDEFGEIDRYSEKWFVTMPAIHFGDPKTADWKTLTINGKTFTIKFADYDFRDTELVIVKLKK